LVDVVDTISAAKDHEALRVALGGERLTFLGLSYGTQLFSQYAELYPDNLRAMVLDGNLQHSQTESSNLLVESTTYEETLEQFFMWCYENQACPLAGRDVRAEYLKVLAIAGNAPIPALDCRRSQAGCRESVNEEELRFNLQGFLIKTANWPRLGQALLDAQSGNASLISQWQPLAMGDAYEDSYLFAGAAIQCQDWSHTSTSLADVVQKQTQGSLFAPLTRGACQTYRIQTSCIGWPATVTNPERPIRYAGNSTLLMVNTLHDPSTSYAWALGLYQELGNAVLLTRNGSGHTSYGLGGETTRAMNDFLVNLTLPEPGTVLNT
jgi:pimeloyl-ACP methyl ester carboxylesterase